MLRQLHSVPGLIFGLILLVLGASGAVLSVDPVMERAVATGTGDQTVAELASVVQAAFPGVERIDRRPNGAVVVTWSTADDVGSDRIDPLTGAVIVADEPNAFMRWVKVLHRSFLLDDPGRIAAGVTAAVMGAMALTGLVLLSVVQGGWGRVFSNARGATGAGWLHLVLGRLAVGLLAVSALTGVWMSLANFDVIDAGLALEPDFPFEVAGTTPAPVGTLAALQTIPVRELERLTFPLPDDPTDVFGLKTVTGSGYVDQATGQALNWLPHNTARLAWEWVYALHTGQGLWWAGAILGLGGLALPVMAVSGALIWVRRRAAHPRIRGNVAAPTADCVILVGSEGGSTWGFAATLHAALTGAGRRVHIAPMNRLRAYPGARHLFILTATYGDGAAPASASQFLGRLADVPPGTAQVTVLGFGDRMFPRFCGYADAVAQALHDQGWPSFHPSAGIDRQSVLDFAAWGQAVGQAMGMTLTLDHRAKHPPLRTLRLISRQDFGQAVQAPVAILRFAADTAPHWWQRALPRFCAGDLIGIIPPGSDLPRLYSLASSRADGWIEICVRKAPGGTCSVFLHDLKVGDTVQAFVRPNPAFRPHTGKSPVIMVAAGCGIGPMAGFVRQMRPGRQAWLYFGARDPASDNLYGAELTRWQAEGRLARMIHAFSRTADRAYVQDRIRTDAATLRDAILRGGQVLVCGGTAMAHGVATEMDVALAPVGLSVAALRSQGRYLEDVY